MNRFILRKEKEKEKRKYYREKVEYLIMMFAFIALNLLGRIIVSAFRLPFWLDMVGTVLASCYLSIPGCIIVAATPNILFGIWDPVTMVYALTSVVVVLALYYLQKKNMMNVLPKAVGFSILIGILSVIVSTPLNLLFHDGYSGNIWGDALVDMLKWMQMPLVVCATAGELVVEIVDKQISVLLAYVIMQAVRKRKKNPDRIKTLYFFLPLVFSAWILLSESMAVRASENGSDIYVGKIFDNTNGIMSSEANYIGESNDGYLWIGSYAGLTRYDGNRFEFIKDGGITGVKCIYNDSKGRIWIGTNDSGVARFDGNERKQFREEEGLAESFICCFAESDDGDMYVGTINDLYRIDAEDHVYRVEEDISYAKTLVWSGDCLLGVEKNGEIFCLGENGLYKGKNGIADYTCVSMAGNVVLAADNAGKVGVIMVSDGIPRFRLLAYTRVMDITSLCKDRNGNIWLCGQSEMGYIDKGGDYHSFKIRGFDSSFECIHADYQGNIWVASSRCGILKITKSMFGDLFNLAGVTPNVANAVTEYEGLLYCATDSGIVVLGEDGQVIKENPLCRYLEEKRVRCFFVDSLNRLWVCTYGEYGLICYESDGTITSFNTSNSGITTDRIRCMMELKNGTLAVGTTSGLNFLKNGKVTFTLTGKDGLENDQILSLWEDEEQTLYVGTDGAGIYLVKDGKIKGRYSTGEGLTSNVILRMVPYDGGLLVVTSNSLCYIKEKQVRVLENFPYFNNFDVLIRDNTLYVLSSAGIFVVDGQKLLSGEEVTYRQYNVSEGLPMGLTANSWNMIKEDRLLICGNNGVISFRMENEEENIAIHYDLDKVLCDGEPIEEKNGRYEIPAGARQIVITPSIRHYLPENVKARVYLEGMDTTPVLLDFDELETLTYSNLSYGNYKLHFEIYNSVGDTLLDEKVYTFEKKPQMWEHWWYKLYLIVIVIEVIAFITWAFFLIGNMSRQKKHLEKLRKELEEQLDDRMGEILKQKENSDQLLRQVVQSLSATVDAKDRYTSGHSERVAEYSRMLAQRMGKDETEQETIYYAGLLHDVGKIRVPDEIINKTGRLDQKEFDFIKLHPVAGYHILKDISGNRKFSEGARFHHERYDGTGYPSGLSGKNIPEIARIIGVADAYDAMTSSRSYRKALPQQVVREEIEKGKGTQFDPEIADIMLEMIDNDPEYKMKQADDGDKNILVVDDEPMNAKMVRFILKEEKNYSILSAENVNDAMDILGQNQVDLILLDIEMPEMNGFDALVMIRERYQIPVVFMTGNKDLESIQRAESMGVEDYVTKPLSPQALQEVIHSILK